MTPLEQKQAEIDKLKELIAHIIPFTERCTIEETYVNEYKLWYKKRKQLESEIASLNQIAKKPDQITDAEIEKEATKRQDKAS